MALGGIDLNLLVVLQALLEEGSVTRAGARLGMPQPAVSNALARLRRHYHDELLRRSGNGHDLTPLGRSLLPAVQESTRLMGRALAPRAADARDLPAIGDRVFTISLSDYAATVLAEPLLRRLRDLAPHARLHTRLATSEFPPGDHGLLGYDLLIAPPRFQPGGQTEVILRDRLVYVADPANSRLRDGRLTPGDLAALPHAAARLPAHDTDPAATALLRHGITPNVVLTTAGWLPLPFLIVGTDLVGAVPERLARQVGAAAGLTVIEPPFEPVELIEAAWWHPMVATDPALSWLRRVIREVATEIDPRVSLPEPRHAGDRG